MTNLNDCDQILTDTCSLVYYNNDQVDIISQYAKSCTKNTFLGWFESAIEIMKYQSQVIKEMRTDGDGMRTEALEAKSKVILLQEELMTIKDDQMTSVHTAVKDGVSAGIESYSSAVSGGSEKQQPQQTIALKKAMKEVVDEEDRSRNLVVFGLAEEEGEDLENKLCSVFQVMGEKPRVVEVVRLGRRETDKSRPIKARFCSSECAHQILRRASTLKQSEEYSSVYISPDRTLEERAERRVADEPGRYHFIKNGRYCTSDTKE